MDSCWGSASMMASSPDRGGQLSHRLNSSSSSHVSPASCIRRWPTDRVSMALSALCPHWSFHFWPGNNCSYQLTVKSVDWCVSVWKGSLIIVVLVVWMWTGTQREGFLYLRVFLQHVFPRNGFTLSKGINILRLLTCTVSRNNWVSY